MARACTLFPGQVIGTLRIIEEAEERWEGPDGSTRKMFEVCCEVCHTHQTQSALTLTSTRALLARTGKERKVCAYCPQDRKLAARRGEPVIPLPLPSVELNNLAASLPWK